MISVYNMDYWTAECIFLNYRDKIANKLASYEMVNNSSYVQIQTLDKMYFCGAQIQAKMFHILMIDQFIK